jgi:hypothetical protein
MMSKIIKNKMIRILYGVFAIALIMLCLHCVPVFAIENTCGSITIDYIDKGIRIEDGECIQKNIALGGAEFSISLVAIESNEGFTWIDQIKNDGDFKYATKSIFDKNTFEEVAKTLVGIAEKQLNKYTQTTDENGQCVFDNLEKGIYLIWESNKSGIAEKYNYAAPFFITIPRRDVDTYELNVTAYPKAEIITEKMITVIGTKTWKGNDIVGEESTASETNPNEIRVHRPDSITLRLYANGIEVANTTVNASQNWSFAFDDINALDENGDEVILTIKEDPIDGYVFSQDKAIFGENTIVINVTNTVDESAAQTGDETNLLKWTLIIALCTVGIIFILFWPTSKKKKINC